MPCELEEEKPSTLPQGVTLFSKPGSPCQQMPTSVYLPPKHLDTSNMLNVVLWLHGWYVENARFLFPKDPSKVRQSVLNSTKDVVLIAPWLGWHKSKKVGNDKDHPYGVRALGTEKWGERYLDDVLSALAKFQNPSSPPALNIDKLVIACHSGGGAGMQNLVGTLGKYQPNLQGVLGVRLSVRAAGQRWKPFAWGDR